MATEATRSVDRAGAPRLGDITRAASVDFLKRLGADIGEHHTTAFASALAYGALFSLVPVIALLVLLLGLFGAVDLVTRAMDELGSVVSPDMLQIIRDQLLRAAQSNEQGAFGVGAIVSIVTALWGASGAVRRTMEALNVVHNAEETRSFLVKNGISILLAIGAVALIGASLVVVVVGGDVAERVFSVIGLGDTAASVWSIARWPALFVLLWLGVAALYRFAPAARQTGGLLTPGTALASIGWVAFTGIFSLYVSLAGNFSAAWGALAGLVILLLYLQYVGMILLIGALVDVRLFDEGRPVSKLRRVVGLSPTK
jgi:membrane protein